MCSYTATERDAMPWRLLHASSLWHACTLGSLLSHALQLAALCCSGASTMNDH